MDYEYFISIIIVCYNYAHLLPRALNAIAEQSFRDFEIVFVDNGCTDNSSEVFSAFLHEHPEIQATVIKRTDGHWTADGENLAVEASRGKYLMFHDADDWMDSDTLELIANTAKEHDADRVITAFRDVDENGNIIQVQYLGEEPNFWLYGLRHGQLFRSSIYHDKKIKVYSHALDSEGSFKFSAYTTNVAYVFKPCYNYFVHLDSDAHSSENYKLALSEYHYSLEKFLKQCIPYLPGTENSDYKFAVYELVRLYYAYLFIYTRDAPITVKFQIYDVLHKTITIYLPDYLLQTQNALQYRKVTQPYARNVALLSSTLERFHLMKLGLIAYHVLSKIIYFQI